MVATYLAGYARLVGLEEESTLAVLRTHRKALIGPLLSEHGRRRQNRRLQPADRIRVRR